MELVQSDEEYQLCLESTEAGKKSNDISSYIFIVLTCFLLAVLLYTTYRVHKLVWANDKVIPMMLVMLNLATFSMIVYFVLNVASDMYPEWACSLSPSYLSCAAFIASAPLFFLSIAVVLNINKWMYFHFRVIAFVKVGFGQPERVESLNKSRRNSSANSTQRAGRVRLSQSVASIRDHIDGLETDSHSDRSPGKDEDVYAANKSTTFAELTRDSHRRDSRRATNRNLYDSELIRATGTEDFVQPIMESVDDVSEVSNQQAMFDKANETLQHQTRWLNTITITFSLLWFILYMFLCFRVVYQGRHDGGDPTRDPISTYCAIVCCFLGCIFFYTGLRMNLTLRKHFPEFYKEFSCLLWFALAILTIPLFIKSTVNLLTTFDKAFEDSYNEHFTVSNITYVLFSTYMPILAQTFSLIFGFMRKRQDSSWNNKLEQKKQEGRMLMGGGSGEYQEYMTETSENESCMSDNRSYFDPPIENYRYYYNKAKAAGARGTGEEAEKSGFQIRRTEKDFFKKNLDETNSFSGANSKLSESKKYTNGGGTGNMTYKDVLSDSYSQTSKVSNSFYNYEGKNTTDMYSSRNLPSSSLPDSNGENKAVRVGHASDLDYQIAHLRSSDTVEEQVDRQRQEKAKMQLMQGAKASGSEEAFTQESKELWQNDGSSSSSAYDSNDRPKRKLGFL